MEETYDKYVRGSNPVQHFVEKAITNGAEKIPKEVLYESYCWFCREKNLPIESEQSFSRKLSKDFGFHSKQVRMNGTKTYCWENIRFIDWKVLEDKSQETLEEIGFTDAEKEALK
jgi:hypothetical protein